MADFQNCYIWGDMPNMVNNECFTEISYKKSKVKYLIEAQKIVKRNP